MKHLTHPNTNAHLNNLENLPKLCVDQLCKSLNSPTGMFDRQLRDQQWGPTLGTEDMTSTAICLVGLSRARMMEQIPKLDPSKSIRTLVERFRASNYIGAIGLIVWANEVCDIMSLDELFKTLGIEIDRFMLDLDKLTTMEMSWLLTGLLHSYQRNSIALPQIFLESVHQHLMLRQEKTTGLFYNATDQAPFAVRIRRNISTFADQIYAIQALSMAAVHLSHSESKSAAATVLRGSANSRERWDSGGGITTLVQEMLLSHFLFTLFINTAWLRWRLLLCGLQPDQILAIPSNEDSPGFRTTS